MTITAHQVMSYYHPYAPPGMVRHQCLTCSDSGLPQHECEVTVHIIDQPASDDFLRRHPPLPRNASVRERDSAVAGGYDED